MEILRQALGEMYEIFGHAPETIKLSEILDRYVVEAQRKELDKWTSIHLKEKKYIKRVKSMEITL